MATSDLVQIVQSIIASPVGQTTGQETQPSVYINLSEVNSSLFGTGASGPLTTTNLTDVIGVSSFVIRNISGNSGNIVNVGSNRMAVSGFWKLTLVISDGTSSFTESVHTGPGVSLSDANGKIYALGSERSKLLGCKVGSAGGVVAKGSPGIIYGRVSDSFNPRNVFLNDWSESPFRGYNASPNTPADFLGVAIMNRMLGVNANDATVQTQTTMTLRGNPDDLVLEARYNGTGISVQAGVTWQQALETYINFLNNPVNKFGFVGQSIADQKKVCTNFVLDTDGLIKVKSVAHGFQNRDKIRLTGSKPVNLNGTYRVLRIDADNFKLLHPGLVDPGAAEIAMAQKIANADGSRTLDFYKYTARLIQPKIRSRKPGRNFDPISHRKKRRK